MNKMLIGIDVGGTKIAAALMTVSGRILAETRQPTPRKSAAVLLKAIIASVKDLLDQMQFSSKEIAGIGIAIPGLVDTKTGTVLTAPNLNLQNFKIAKELEARFHTKIAVGNDVNLGILGEAWLGAARNAENVVGIFPGTGVGGGILIDGQLLLGRRGLAGELGHVQVDPDGPECSCGNVGCLEAIAGRWAIEKNIRKAIKDGKKTIITKLLDNKVEIIRSKMLRKALKKEDAVVTKIMKKAAVTLGRACVSFRHTFDPQCIILGGGLVEACGFFILPIVQKELDEDAFYSQFGRCPVIACELEDDAVIYGAAALIEKKLGIYSGASALYPKLQVQQGKSILLERQKAPQNFYVRSDGKIVELDAAGLKELGDPQIEISDGALKVLCKKNPRVLIIAKQQSEIKFSAAAKVFLDKKGIQVKMANLSDAVDFYNQFSARKVFLTLHAA